MALAAMAEPPSPASQQLSPMKLPVTPRVPHEANALGTSEAHLEAPESPWKTSPKACRACRKACRPGAPAAAAALAQLLARGGLRPRLHEPPDGAQGTALHRGAKGAGAVDGAGGADGGECRGGHGLEDWGGMAVGKSGAFAGF